jgi:hypothetical protein
LIRKISDKSEFEEDEDDNYDKTKENNDKLTPHVDWNLEFLKVLHFKPPKEISTNSDEEEEELSEKEITLLDKNEFVKENK